jgi:hypothetical protein
MRLGDGVERAVAEAQDAAPIVVGPITALAQKPTELGRVRRRDGDLAAERFGRGSQRSRVAPCRSLAAALASNCAART